MTKLRIKLIVAVITLITVLLSAFSFTYATGTKKMLEAWFGLNNIKYKNQDLTTSMQPFAVNGVTYIPLRQMGELFNKNIGWDQATKSVIITDKPDQTVTDLNAQVTDLKSQLAIKESENAQLQAKITELEGKANSDTKSLSDLQNALNDDYGTYKSVNFDITLSGDSDDIAVKIEADMGRDQDDWDAISSANRKSYLQNICDDITDKFDNANISGYISDSSSSSAKKLLTFTVSSSGIVSTGTSSSSGSTSLGDLEDTLNDDYGEYKNVGFDISLDGDEDEIIVNVEVDLKHDQDNWDNLDDSERLAYLKDVCGDIQDEYEDATITGTIKDGSGVSPSVLFRFYVDTHGNVKSGTAPSSSSSDSNLSDLEDELSGDYSDYFDNIELEVELEKSGNTVTFTVDVDLDEYRSEWRDLDEADIKRFMFKIYDDIKADENYGDCTVQGYIYDTDAGENIAKAFVNSFGTETLNILD